MSRCFALPVAAGLVAAVGFCASVTAQVDPIAEDPAVSPTTYPVPVFIDPVGLVPVTRYATGETVLLESNVIVRPMCGSDMSQITVDDLRRTYLASKAKFDRGESFVLDNSPATRGGGLNLVFNLTNDVPQVAVDAIAVAEAFIESQFGDPVTVTINVDYANQGGGVLGSTGSFDLADSWSDVRAGLINGKDGNDTIQDSLPTGSTIPVRYTSTSTSITNENRVFVNRANYEATIGSVGGIDASMTINETVSWDYDPSNGVSGFDFMSTFIHEVGHALGFTSGTDFRSSDIEMLDVYRFSRNDNVNGVNGDWNPDNLSEFQTQARMVDPDNPSTSSDNTEVDANSDLISVEYRMSDGFPNQASHFVEGLNAIMDPTSSPGQTFFPNYYRTADLDMFDAIGWDYPPSAPSAFAPVSPANGATNQPVELTIEWEVAVPTESYDLILADNPGFSSPVFDVNLPTNQLNVLAGNLDPLTTYYWSVTANNGAGSTTMSPSTSTFTTGALAPGTFSLTSPPNFASVSTTPLLDWDSSAGADSYLLEVATSGTFAFGIAISETVNAPDTEYQVMGGELAADEEYFWRVTAQNAGGMQVSSPTASRFTTDFAPLNSCLADFDNDGDVDLTDFGTFGAAFGSSLGDANYSADADFDDDNDVDLTDFGTFGSEFGRMDCLD